MAKIVVPGESERTSIVIETRMGNRILNNQAWDLPRPYVAEAERWRKTYEPTQARNVGNLIPVYNCHGMTFASRRSIVFESGDVRRIIDDDGYVEIKDVRDVLPGDIVLYVASDGDIEHSGIVLQAAPFDTGSIPMPRVLSKWGLGEEWIHWANACPYKGIRQYFRMASYERKRSESGQSPSLAGGGEHPKVPLETLESGSRSGAAHLIINPD